MTLTETGDYGMNAFAAETLLARLQALTKEFEGVRSADDDIEFVHRMRVASRRLRTALSIFADCFPTKKAENWLRDIRRVTRALGAARDLDVQLAVVDDFTTRATDERMKPGLARLLLRLRQSRAAVQHKVTRALARLETDQTTREMEEALRRLRVRDRLSPEEDTTDALRALARTAITDHLIELLSYEPYVTQPEKKEELHAMRIAAKHLRYTLELFAPLYTDGLKEFIKLARTMQELLGDIHDCDVWALLLPTFLAEERQKALDYAGNTRGVSRMASGIEAMQVDRATFRDTRYREFAARWEKSHELWDTLLSHLQPPLVN